MQRRNFVEHVASRTVATSGAVGLDVDRLIALLPHAEPPGARHIGAADVAAIEQTTAEFARQDFAAGSGPIRDLA